MCCYAAECKCPNRLSRRADAIVSKTPYKVCPYTPAALFTLNEWDWKRFTPECICTFPLNEPVAPQRASNIIPYTDDKQGNISTVSFGETGGLYPTPGAQNTGLFEPKTWDEELTTQLLKCHAAVNLVATRGESYKTALPDLSNKTERMLTAYHLKDNFPAVDPVIKADPSVRFFYLSPDKDAKHAGIDYANWDVKMVQAYGPFYNIGGGDVPKGATYVLFYSVKPKQKPGKQ